MVSECANPSCSGMDANRTPSPRVAAHIPWALTHEVICHAQCPVLTVSN